MPSRSNLRVDARDFRDEAALKNQYAGDINDFRKYGLIRALTGPGDLSIFCCWMLTPDDGGPDGQKTAYLGDPATWRGHDPQLFDALATVVADPAERGVAAVEAAQVLKRTRFHSDVIPDDAEGRAAYFSEAATSFSNSGLVFFDPDNGLEVPSKQKGRRGSSKYVYWDEVECAFGAGASVLIYQHFPRRPRDIYTRERVNRLRSTTGATWVASFATSHVLFLLAPRPDHEEHLMDGCRRVQSRWGDQFTIRLHRAALRTD